MKKAVVIKSVSKNFGSIPAVQDMNLQIDAGTIFGLLGPNGSGKSTIMKLLLGLVKPDVGEIMEHLGSRRINRDLNELPPAVGITEYIWIGRGPMYVLDIGREISSRPRDICQIVIGSLSQIDLVGATWLVKQQKALVCVPSMSA